MNGPHDTLPDGLPPGEELLAYLDGELDAESRRRMDEQLSVSGELRQRLKEHQQAWDLLDELPRASVDDSFTHTTVEMVAIQAGDEVNQAQRTKRRRQQLAWALVVLSSAAAGVIGFFLTAQRLAKPNDRIVEDLPIIEHLDAYRNAGSVEFLRRLDEQKLFHEDDGNAFSRQTNVGILSAAMWSVALGSAPSVGSADETMDQRRARLEKMLSLEKDELLRNHKRLEQLKPEQQVQLRDLEQQLANDPQGDRLRKVMLQYHEWLKVVPTSERAGLLSLKSDEEKIARIKSMLEKQETDRLSELVKATLTHEDVNKVRAWFGELVLRKKSELIQHLPERNREKLIATEDPRRLVFELSNQFRDKDKPPPLIRMMELLSIDEQERLRLVGKLSSPAADVYRRQANEQDKRTVLQNWVYATMSRPRMPSNEELRDLLNGLSAEERDRIENLPPEQMKNELTRHFFVDRMRRGNPDGKRPNPGDGPRQGDPRNRPPFKPKNDAEELDK